MRGKVIHFLVLALALPTLFNFVVYHGFTTNYRIGVYSEDQFSMRYDHGIYRYRVLGKYLLRTVNEFLEKSALGSRFAVYLIPASVRPKLGIVDAPTLYASFFVLNTLFLCLTAAMLYLLLHLEIVTVAPAVRDQLLFLLILLIVISQFVIVPYDMLSYFFLTASMLAILVFESWYSFLVLLLLVVLATLTRETAALILSFYATVHLHRRDLMTRENLVRLLTMSLGFVGTYGLLRVLLGAESATHQAFRLFENLTSPSSLVGIALLLAIAYGLVRNARNPRSCLLFLFLASPYVVAVLAIADPWELRLWIPIVIPLAIVAVLDQAPARRPLRRSRQRPMRRPGRRVERPEREEDQLPENPGRRL